MRSIITTLAALAFTACVPDVYNEYDVDINMEAPETEDTGAPVVDDTASEDTAEGETETVYYVPDTFNQVVETDTRLEFRDAVTWSEDSWYETYAPQIECAMVTVGVPEDAGQGVFLFQIDYGAYGLDLQDSGWTNGLYAYGTSSEVLMLTGFQIFRDADSYVGAEAYSEYDSFSYTDAFTPNYAAPNGCWSDSCHTTAYGLRPDYYIPIGEDATIGFCMAWRRGSVVDWSTMEVEYGDPIEPDWAHAVIGEITWEPADSQDFRSKSVAGLILPATFMSFPEASE